MAEIEAAIVDEEAGRRYAAPMQPFLQLLIVDEYLIAQRQSVAAVIIKRDGPAQVGAPQQRLVDAGRKELHIALITHAAAAQAEQPLAVQRNGRIFHHLNTAACQAAHLIVHRLHREAVAIQTAVPGSLGLMQYHRVILQRIAAQRIIIPADLGIGIFREVGRVLHTGPPVAGRPAGSTA